jgi:hypothetical protein
VGVSRSPAVVLYDANGVAMAVSDGVAIPANTKGVLLAGSDGTNARIIGVDSSRRAAIQNQPNMDVALSTRATEATLATRASEATLATRASETTLASRATEATLATRASEATLATRATAAAQTDGSHKTQVADAGGDVLAISASGEAAIQNPPNLDVALSTRATEATLATRATEATLAAADAKLATIDAKLATIDAVLDAIKDTDGVKRITDPIQTDFTVDRDKIVGVSFAKLDNAATAYFMGIDLSNTTDYHHVAGTGIVLVQSIGKAFKSSAGSKWSVQLLVVTRVDGTDADLVILPQASLALRDTSKLAIDEQVVDLFPHFADLTVSGGKLAKSLSNSTEENVAAVNTGVTLEDAAGNTVAPAVGDLLIRVLNVSGGGTIDFAYGLQYFVE